MKKYKSILLFSSLMLFCFPLTDIEVNARGKNPIYNPTNPTQEVEPMEPSGYPRTKTKESTDSLPETSSKHPEESTESSQQMPEEPKEHSGTPTRKKKRKKLMLNDDLFIQENNVINTESVHWEPMGGSGKEDSYYLRLVSELAGTILYGRENG